MNRDQEMNREWNCILAGGVHHGTMVSRAVDAASTFPPAVTMDDGLYLPMTMTSLSHTGAEQAGACVMAHSQASEWHSSLSSASGSTTPVRRSFSASSPNHSLRPSSRALLVPILGHDSRLRSPVGSHWLLTLGLR